MRAKIQKTKSAIMATLGLIIAIPALVRACYREHKRLTRLADSAAPEWIN